uniref:Intraflagellar transport protein osm-1 (inferred by orthology to a C. elegans protein) n=1 Tax=Strongyloides venezuelensis TaxID=75913 RepID=A0A0K0F112_STRVS
MKLRFLDTIIDSQLTSAKIPSISWSLNNKKLAIATKDRNIYLFDATREQKDRFHAKPIESKYGKNSFTITAITFSPDSLKLAVGQSDNIVFIYKLGKNWDEKKVISNKFQQSSTVTCLIWPEDNRLVVGLMDGKVRFASCHSNKISTVYKTDQAVVSLAKHPTKRSFCSGHIDGSIIVYHFDTKSQQKICTHLTTPFALIYTNFGILASGCDQRIISYTESGRLLQTFDYTKDPTEKEYVVGVVDPTGTNAVFGSFNRLRLMIWNQRRGAWDEGNTLDIKNLYTITSLSWKPDGSTIVVGSLCGAVIAIDCSLKKILLKNQFEVTYVSPSQIVIKDTVSEYGNNISIRSNKGYNIRDIRIMGRTNKFVVAYTTNSLILSNMEKELTSEVMWNSGGNEKFIMESDNCCMIVNAGEISIVEYGIDDIIGWIRTEIINPHLLSIRLNERISKVYGDRKRIAYLVDYNNIHVMDLLNNTQIAHINHPTHIDWLELNETGNKLLFRDVRSRVQLYEVDEKRLTSLINFCSYIQWVPGSDVVVGQSNENLCIWYSTDQPDQVTLVPIKGDVQDVYRDDKKTEVIVIEGNSRVSYELDNTLIEFGTSMDDLNLSKAVNFLENNDYTHSIEMLPMWRQLGTVAIQEERLHVASRSFAAMKNYCKVAFIHEILNDIEESPDKFDDYKVKAKLSLLNGNYKEAEKYYIKNNNLDEAINMYKNLHKWDEAITLGKGWNYTKLGTLQQDYYKYLFDTGQDQKAGECKEKDGDLHGAIDLYLKGSASAKAARVLLENDKLIRDEILVDRIIQALQKSDNYEKIGEIYERLEMFDKSMEGYKKGNCYSKAISLARKHYPEEVVDLEEKWGDWLVRNGLYEESVSHYLEAGEMIKAVDSSIKGKDYDKAIQITSVMEPNPDNYDYFFKIGEYFEEKGNYDEAEKYYIDAKKPEEALNMYNRKSQWAEAHRLATEIMDGTDAQKLYLEKAEKLEMMGKFKDAEELYISIGEPKKAIAMYRHANKITEMMLLVEKYHPEYVVETRKRLAEEFERNGDYKSAEEQYLISGDWKSCVDMYMEVGEWSDGYRIAKQEGGENAGRNVIYLWAKTLGGDSGVKLLQKYNILDEVITIACQNNDFNFAFDMAKIGSKEKLPMVYKDLAEHMEEENNLQEAEKNYILGEAPREAVNMYINNQMLDDAERIAKEYVTDMLNEIYIGQATIAVRNKDYSKAETYLLRADKPEMILNYYKENNMWEDALRIASDYLPLQLNDIQKEYDNVQLKSGGKGVASYVAQAKDFEVNEDYLSAVNTLLKIKPPITENEEIIVTALKKAADLTLKFITTSNRNSILSEIVKQLDIYGLYLDEGEIYLLWNKPKEAIEALVKGKEYSKAKRIATELAPEMTEYVEEEYKKYLANAGNINELISIDVISGIDLLIQKNQWTKALDIAVKQNHQPLVDKYVAMYVGELLKDNMYKESIKAFETYGTSSNKENLNIYRKLFECIVNENYEYDTISSLRNMLLNLLKKLETDNNESMYNLFIRYLQCIHFICMGESLSEFSSSEVEEIKLKLKISLLRYIDLLPADRIFYEAGIACKEYGKPYENMAFTFLNMCLDVTDAIEDNDPSIVDNSIFVSTDIPTQYPLPEKKFIPHDEHEEIKEWVLAVSVDTKIDKELLLDSRGLFEGCIMSPTLTKYDMCIISGYPILGNPKILSINMKAIGKYWDTFSTISKTNNTDKLQDVQIFLSKWAGAPISII